MTDDGDKDLPQDMAQALQCLEAARDMYKEILQASLDHAGRGDLDIPAFLKRLNGALVAFKPYDTQAARLLDQLSD